VFKGVFVKKEETTKNADSTVSFEIGEGLNLLNPLTDGLGFKDRVSQDGYTSQEPESIAIKTDADVESSYGGTFDIGHEELGDGVLNIQTDGSLEVESAETVQPILFHSGHDSLIKKRAKKSGESFFGALIDVMLLFAFSILSAAVVTEFTSYTFNFEKLLVLDPTEIGKFLLVFSAYFLSYKLLTRVFFGKTLGEWSSRHQLGLVLHQHDVTYPFRVLAREVMCLLTGVFFFPLISSVIRKDIGFYVSGLHTYIEQNK
jgi:hypothetical protein